MNPFALIGGAASIFGLGLTIEGTMQATSAAKEEAAISGNIAQIQMQENEVRRQAMEFSAQRQKIETARNTQLTAARSLATAVGQGAQFSSSAQAGQQQARSEGAFQEAGIETNRQLGEKMFGLDTSIDIQKIAMAQAQSKLASAQGLESLGQGIGGAGMNIFKMFS